MLAVLRAQVQSLVGGPQAYRPWEGHGQKTKEKIVFPFNFFIACMSSIYQKYWEIRKLTRKHLNFTILETYYHHINNYLLCVFSLELFVLHIVHVVIINIHFSSVAQSFLTLCDPMNRSTPGRAVYHQISPKLMAIESVMPSNHLIFCHPLLLLPSVFPSIRVSSGESVLHIRWPKYWSFSFNISPSNQHPGLISFRMDWLDHLAVQGTLKSLLQHHSSKASIFQSSAFFVVQLSHP